MVDIASEFFRHFDPPLGLQLEVAEARAEISIARAGKFQFRHIGAESARYDPELYARA